MDAVADGVGQIEILPLYPLHEYEDVLCGLYRRIRRHDLQRMFWWREDPIDLRGFLNHLADNRLPLVGYDEEMSFLGMGWIENMVGKQQCSLGGWLPFSSRGLNAVDIMKALLEYAHGPMGFRTVFCHTPWPTAAALCKRANMNAAGIIKSFPLANFDTTYYIMRSDRES